MCLTRGTNARSSLSNEEILVFVYHTSPAIPHFPPHPFPLVWPDAWCCLHFSLSAQRTNIMERGHGLADLTLVNKYFPVANYSYPRSENANGYYEPRRSLRSPARLSLGSNGTPPGLVDDKSDSDCSFSSSFESDRNYEVRAAELWDSFWEPSAHNSKPRTTNSFSKKDYSFLTQAQTSGAKPLAEADKTWKTNDFPGAAAWPLNGDASLRSRHRKPAATYSAFPKPLHLPPRVKPASPSWENSRPREPPKRPARPDVSLTLFTELLSYAASRTDAEEEEDDEPEVSPTTIKRPSTAKETERPGSFVFSPPALKTEIQRPTTSHETRRAASPVEHTKLLATPHLPSIPVCYLPTKPLDNPYERRPRTPPPTPIGAPQICPIHGDSSTRDPYTTNSYLLHPGYLGDGGCCLIVPAREPHSVFEDSDDEDENDTFFRRLHKRSVSDLRRWRRSGESQTGHRTRGRTNTAPSLPDPSKRRGWVFNRMLGRRNS